MDARPYCHTVVPRLLSSRGVRESRGSTRQAVPYSPPSSEANQRWQNRSRRARRTEEGSSREAELSGIEQTGHRSYRETPRANGLGVSRLWPFSQGLRYRAGDPSALCFGQEQSRCECNPRVYARTPKLSRQNSQTLALPYPTELPLLLRSRVRTIARPRSSSVRRQREDGPPALAVVGRHDRLAVDAEEGFQVAGQVLAAFLVPPVRVSALPRQQAVALGEGAEQLPLLGGPGVAAIGHTHLRVVVIPTSVPDANRDGMTIGEADAEVGSGRTCRRGEEHHPVVDVGRWNVQTGEVTQRLNGPRPWPAIASAPARPGSLPAGGSSTSSAPEFAARPAATGVGSASAG